MVPLRCVGEQVRGLYFKWLCELCKQKLDLKLILVPFLNWVKNKWGLKTSHNRPRRHSMIYCSVPQQLGGEITWQIQNPTTKQKVIIPTWGQPHTHTHTHSLIHTHTHRRWPQTSSYLNLSVPLRLTKRGVVKFNSQQKNTSDKTSVYHYCDFLFRSCNTILTEAGGWGRGGGVRASQRG